MRALSRPGLFLALVCVLTACTTVQPVPDDTFWSFDGKVSIQKAGETQVLSIHWVQTAMRSDIRLSAALGAGSAKLTVEHGLLRVETGDIDETYPLDGMVVLAGQSYPIPLQHLVYWLRGKQDANGEPLVIGVERSDWRVSQLRSDELGPRLLQLEHPEANLKLKVKRWRFDPASA